MEAITYIDNGMPVASIFKQIKNNIPAFFHASIEFIPGDGSRISFWCQNWDVRFWNQSCQTYSYAQIVATRDVIANFKPNLSTEAQSELVTIT